MGEYQRKFLDDPSLKRGSITLTERKVIVAFEKNETPRFNNASIVAYDTNELSLDGVLATHEEIKPVHSDLRAVARIHAIHFERRRRIQNRLIHCRRKLRVKLAEDRGRERRRVDAVLHKVAKEQLRLANVHNAKIVLEDLHGVRRHVNRRGRKLNQHNDRIQPLSVSPKALKRRLNIWPFRRLHGFIEYKAKWAGVPLAYVPAWNTSRTCAKCGCLRTGHRGEQDPKTCRVFTCPKCG
jgi:putative transposase